MTTAASPTARRPSVDKMPVTGKFVDVPDGAGGSGLGDSTGAATGTSSLASTGADTGASSPASTGAGKGAGSEMGDGDGELTLLPPVQQAGKICGLTELHTVSLRTASNTLHGKYMPSAETIANGFTSGPSQMLHIS